MLASSSVAGNKAEKQPAEQEQSSSVQPRASLEGKQRKFSQVWLHFFGALGMGGDKAALEADLVEDVQQRLASKGQSSRSGRAETWSIRQLLKSQAVDFGKE